MTRTRTVHPGDTEPSCYHCRYFTGHAPWCPQGTDAEGAGELSWAHRMAAATGHPAGSAYR
jgi:hypothetical protein